MRRLAVAVILLAGCAGMAWADPAPITFNGVDFVFHDIGRINNGWGAYYTPWRQEPNQSRDEIIVNYMDRVDAEGHAITAQQLAEKMLGSIKENGGKTLLPFAAPDEAFKNRLSYYVHFFYVYPQDHNGDIWIARVAQDDERAIGILYKHQIDGTDAGDIEAKAVGWLKDNMKSTPIDKIVPPPEPPHS